MNLKVLYRNIIHDQKPLEKQHIEDAGFDIRANESGIIKPGEIRLIHTGIYLDMEDGYEAQVRPRSGLALKNGVTINNSPGTIDSSYRGEVGCILINHGDKDFSFVAGDRIAQLVIQRIPQVTLEVVDVISSTTRGAGGFGSTGV